jgi:hypothetical protein
LINISINIGPAIVWLSMIFITFFFVCAAFLLGGIRERVVSTRDVEKRMNSMLQMRHVAPGPPLLPQRVDPKSGIILRRWGAEEEQEEAA